MTDLIISRCIKKPGFIVGARTYRLVKNINGLYIIEIGKAMMETPKTNIVSDAIANALIDKLAEKREKDMSAVEKGIAGKDLNQLVDNKKCFLIRKEDIKEIKLSTDNYELKLSIKSAKLKIELYFWPEDKAILETIYSQLT